MICPKCKKEYKTYRSFCINCYTKLDTSEFLNKIYGYYMKIPPKEDRYNHIYNTVDFGPYK